jgi:hypothetical protein
MTREIRTETKVAYKNKFKDVKSDLALLTKIYLK